MKNLLCFLLQPCLRHQLDMTCWHLGNFQVGLLPLAKCIWHVDDKSIPFKGVCVWGGGGEDPSSISKGLSIKQAVGSCNGD